MKIFLILILITSSYALSTSQVNTIKLVKREASKFTRYKSTIAAICMTESSAGVQVLGDKKQSLGILQIQVDTARYVATIDKELLFLTKLPRKNIETLLLKNDRLSIRIASVLIQHYVNHYGYKEAISRFNGGRRNWTYYRKVKLALKIVNKIH